MIFRLLTGEHADGNTVLELDAEGIDYLEDGLRQVREGAEVSTPMLDEDEDGPTGTSELVVRRVDA